MKKTKLSNTVVIALLVIGLFVAIWYGAYMCSSHSVSADSNYRYALLETANESIAAVDQNIKEAKSNLDELLSMQNFQEPVKSLIEVKYLASAETLFVSAERIAISGMLNPLSQIPLKDRYPLDLSKEIFSARNTLSGEQGSAMDAITNDIYSGKFSRSDLEYLKKLDALLGKLAHTLKSSTIYSDTNGALYKLKTVNSALIELSKEKPKEKNK